MGVSVEVRLQADLPVGRGAYALSHVDVASRRAATAINRRTGTVPRYAHRRRPLPVRDGFDLANARQGSIIFHLVAPDLLLSVIVSEPVTFVLHMYELLHIQRAIFRRFGKHGAPEDQAALSLPASIRAALLQETADEREKEHVLDESTSPPEETLELQAPAEEPIQERGPYPVGASYISAALEQMRQLEPDDAIKSMRTTIVFPDGTRVEASAEVGPRTPDQLNPPTTTR